jgi:hypothetical protein
MNDFDRMKEEAHKFKDTSLMSAIGSGGGFSTIDPMSSDRRDGHFGQSIIRTNFQNSIDGGDLGKSLEDCYPSIYDQSLI